MLFWLEIYKWFGLVEVLPDTVGAMFLSFFGAFKVAKKRHKGIVMLWQAVIWLIWRVRNDVIFAQKSHSVIEAVEKIKRIYLGNEYWLRNRALRACIMNVV
jgi:hypothetical protein